MNKTKLPIRSSADRRVVSRCAQLLLTSLTLATLVGPAAQAVVGQTHSITVYADTRLKSPGTNSFVQARRTRLSLDDLDHLALLTKDGVDVIHIDETKTVDVTLFLPKDMDPADEQAFVKEIERRLNTRYATVVYTVKKAYIASAEALARGTSDQNRSDEEKTSLKQLHGWAARTKYYARMIREESHHPESVDLTMGSVIGSALAAGSAGYWLAATGFNFFGYSGAAILLSFNVLNNAFTTQINKFKTDHKIPIGENTRLVQLYNSNPFIKAMTFNEIMNYVITAGLRTLSHLENNNIPGASSKAFMKPYFGLRLLLGPSSGASDFGVVTLLRKGYISRRASQYTFSAINALSLMNSLLLSAGTPLAMKIWKPAVSGEVAIRTLVWGVSKWLPAKQNRLVILHPNLSEPSDINRDQIEYANDLRGLVLNDETVPRSTLRDLLSRNGLTMDSIPEERDDMVMSMNMDLRKR